MLLPKYGMVACWVLAVYLRKDYNMVARPASIIWIKENCRKESDKCLRDEEWEGEFVLQVGRKYK